MVNVQDWSGRVGEEWADKAEALDGMLGPFGDAGIDALGDVVGKRIIDLGCGAGATSIALADRGALVTGVDVSEALLDVARTRDPDMRCAFVLADAGEVELARRFDALYSRCGAMFFDAPVPAFRHLHGQLRDGAALSIVCWTDPADNEWAQLPLDLAAPILGPCAPSVAGRPGPFAWAREGVFLPILREAGFSGISAEIVERDAPVGAGLAEDPLERAAHFCTRIGPLARHLRDHGRDMRAEVRDALMDGFAGRVANGAVHLKGRAWVITAQS